MVFAMWRMCLLEKDSFQGTEKAQVFVSSLDTPLTIWLDEAQVCYDYDGVEGKLVSGMSLAGAWSIFFRRNR